MHTTDVDPAADRLQPISRPLRPLNDRILVRRLDDAANQSALLLPECSQTLSRRGQVVAVGPGKRDEYGKRSPLAVKVGDIVYFGRFTDYDDGQLLLIQESDIVGVCT